MVGASLKDPSGCASSLTGEPKLVASDDLGTGEERGCLLRTGNYLAFQSHLPLFNTPTEFGSLPNHPTSSLSLLPFKYPIPPLLPPTFAEREERYGGEEDSRVRIEEAVEGAFEETCGDRSANLLRTEMEKAREFLAVKKEESDIVSGLSIPGHRVGIEPSYYEGFFLRGIRIDKASPGFVACTFRVPPRLTLKN